MEESESHMTESVKTRVHPTFRDFSFSKFFEQPVRHLVDEYFRVLENNDFQYPIRIMFSDESDRLYDMARIDMIKIIDIIENFILPDISSQEVGTVADKDLSISEIFFGKIEASHALSSDVIRIYKIRGKWRISWRYIFHWHFSRYLTSEQWEKFGSILTIVLEKTEKNAKSPSIEPRVRTHSQNMTVAARAQADRNRSAQRS